MPTNATPEDLMEQIQEFASQKEEAEDPEEVIEFYRQILESQDYWLKLTLNWYQELINSYMEGEESVTIRFDVDMLAGTCKETEISFGESAKASASKLWVPGDPSNLSLS